MLLHKILKIIKTYLLKTSYSHNNYLKNHFLFFEFENLFLRTKKLWEKTRFHIFT